MRSTFVTAEVTEVVWKSRSIAGDGRGFEGAGVGSGAPERPSCSDTAVDQPAARSEVEKGNLGQPAVGAPRPCELGFVNADKIRGDGGDRKSVV